MLTLLSKISVLHRNTDLFLALAVVSVLILLLFPLTDLALDTLISVSIVLSVTTLLVTLYADEPLSFSSFPSFLLCLTLFRLGLNIASTRMILSEAHAGQIIQTFGDVVTGGNAFVGFVIFLLLTGVNFAVITKGSGRVAEVAARFTLDSLPGKQLSIDADVSAGIIDESEAKRRREKIIAEADFYGAMDGASKFVRGDAIASIVLIIVNIIGGFIVGMGFRGLDWKEVVQIYVTLSVGDGLVTQIPALLVSVGAGIIVTRTSAKENLAESFRKQLFNNPRLLVMTGSILLFLGLIPGMPILVMGFISAVIFLYAYSLHRYSQEPQASLVSDAEAKAEKAVQAKEGIEEFLQVEPIEVEVGQGLVTLVQGENEGLLKRTGAVRRQIANELGIVVPSMRIHDNFSLDPYTYTIKIRGNEVASGKLLADRLLAMNPGYVSTQIPGIETKEPAFGFPAKWIAADQREPAIASGYIVADPLSIMTTHLGEAIRYHADEFLTRQEVHRLIEYARTFASAVVDELIPLRLSLGQVRRVLQNLLRERVSIRDIASILEILADHCTTTQDTELLSEYVRQGFARTLSKQFLSADRQLHVFSLDTKLEQALQEAMSKNDLNKEIVVHPHTLHRLVQEISAFVNRIASMGAQPILLTNPSLRPYLRKLITPFFPRLPILSYQEIVPDVPLKNVGIVSPDILMQ